MSIFFHYGNLNRLIKRCPVTCTLILINTLFLIVCVITGGYFGAFSIENLTRLGGLVPFFVIEFKQYHRLILPMFLHGSVIHYLFNTFFGLLILSAGLEKLLGSLKFTIIYLLSGLISSIIVLLSSAPYFIFNNFEVLNRFSRFLTYPFSLTIGASGAIYGVLGTFLYIIVYQRDLLNYQDQSYVRTLLIINIIFTFIAPSISLYGHLGGLLGGFLIGTILLNHNRRNYY